MLKEALLVVSLGNNIDKQEVLFPHAINLVVLVLDYGALAVPGHALLHVLLLRDV